MFIRSIQRLLTLASRVGADVDDTPVDRVQKSSLVLGASMFIAAGAIWGVLYIFFGQTLAGVIPLSYAAISFCSVVYFHLTRRFRPFLFTQLLFILLLPFFLMIALGGFVSSSAVILWSLICPLAALLFDQPRRGLRWLAAYLFLVAISGLLEARPLATTPLPPNLVTLFFVLNIGVVSAIVILLLAYFVSQKNNLFDLLQIEQGKSENLLLNILPKEIAAILRNESRTIADFYDSASVLFADMVGFTPLSARMEPVEVVELLNEVFSFFDSLLDKYGVEKIRTIGDSYMAVCGAPRRRTDHAQALVGMALEMRDYIVTNTFRNGCKVHFRIGINSGSMVAGVIGKRKFVYDIWGDAVNVASRMESHGLSDEIQITQATYETVKDQFICESRGAVAVKGKGEMNVWLVLAAKE